MSALMAERRDWAEDPRQASLFDALAPPPERAQPGHESEASPTQARVVDFPKRPTVPAAPASPTEPTTPSDAAGSSAPPGPQAASLAPTTGSSEAASLAPTTGSSEAASLAPTTGSSEAASLAPTTGSSEAASLAPAPEPLAPRAAAVADTAPAAAGASAIEAEIVVAPEDLAGDETCTPRVAGSPLAGPTLDDVMSRVWEGLATGLPAACPVCHGEVLPFAGEPLRGRCTSCGTTID